MNPCQSSSATLVEALQSDNENLQPENAELKTKLTWYEEQFRRYKHKQFGIKDKCEKGRYRIRQEEGKPMLDKLKQWLDKQQALVPPKSLLGKAITYGLNQWPYLVRYLESGLLDIDINGAGRAIKPFVVGRKNWLFAHSVKGAHASAILYSLVETAKAIGLEPYFWLTYVLKHLPEMEPGRSVEHLLPLNLTPEDIRKA